MQIQALAEHKLPLSEKQSFFVTLRKLAAAHDRLPDSMVITDEVEFPNSSQPYTSGGFADIKQGKYKSHTVAVKTMRVAVSDNFRKISRNS
jgi:chitodextrinase